MSKKDDTQEEIGKMQIRNSIVDFLVFTKDSKNESIEVRVQDNEVWLTQKAMGVISSCRKYINCL
ncbi:MAG: hypothetical protein PUB79_04885 [Succinivibrio sp.]|nr:hypothetical protein [Succinivibrio sp.]